jgi:signal transduction histidine kinase
MSVDKESRGKAAKKKGSKSGKQKAPTRKIKGMAGRPSPSPTTQEPTPPLAEATQPVPAQPKKKKKSKAKTAGQPVTKLDLWTRAIDALSPGTIIAVPHGDAHRIVKASRQLQTLFSVSQDELLGKELSEFWEVLLARIDNPGALRADLERLTRNRYEERTDILRFARPYPMVVERSTAPLFSEDGQYVGRVWAFRSVNREFVLKEELQKKRRSEMMFRNLSETLLDFENLHEKSSTLTRYLCMGMDSVSVLYFPRSGHGLGSPCQYSISKKFIAEDEALESMASFADDLLAKSNTTEVVERLVSEVEGDEAGAFFEDRGLVRFLLAPLIWESTRFGIFIIEEHDPERQWSREDVKVARAATDIISFWLAKRETQQRMERSQSEADAANRARADFIALLSHELRTPLNPLIGFTQLLEESSDSMPEGVRDMVGRIADGSKRLRELVEDLLTLTRLDSRLDGWRKYHCDPRGIAQDACTWIKGLAIERGVGLLMETEGDVGVIQADGAALRRAINALLSNAVRFSPEQSDATARLVVHGAADAVTFRVYDTGPGVSEEQKGKIFEPFVQGEPVLTRRFGGAGIGLTLVRRVAESHGGRVWVDDGATAGSVFCLRIPRNLDD